MSENVHQLEVATANEDNADDGEIAGALIAVPDGEYELAYMRYETANYFGHPKVVVHCAIINPDEYAGLCVARFYNVDRLKGRPRPKGGFVAPQRGALVRELRALIGANLDRNDRISFDILRGKRLIANLCQVSSGYDKRTLSSYDRYSKIERFVGIRAKDNL